MLEVTPSYTIFVYLGVLLSHSFTRRVVVPVTGCEQGRPFFVLSSHLDSACNTLICQGGNHDTEK